MPAIKVIIRLFVTLFAAIVMGIISYIGARIGERFVVYSQMTITRIHPRKRRMPVGFVS